MIGKNTFKIYQIKTIEDYFNLIIDSRVNGNYQDTRDYIKKLSKEQKKLFINYLIENEPILKSEIIKIVSEDF